MQCKACGTELADDADYCIRCGRAQPSRAVKERLTCPKCGIENRPDRIICYKCGTSLRSHPSSADAADETDARFGLDAAMMEWLYGPKVAAAEVDVSASSTPLHQAQEQTIRTYFAANGAECIVTSERVVVPSVRGFDYKLEGIRSVGSQKYGDYWFAYLYGDDRSKPAGINFWNESDAWACAETIRIAVEAKGLRLGPTLPYVPPTPKTYSSTSYSRASGQVQCPNCGSYDVTKGLGFGIHFVLTSITFGAWLFFLLPYRFLTRNRIHGYTCLNCRYGFEQ